jgi:hypothetical protein
MPLLRPRRRPRVARSTYAPGHPPEGPLRKKSAAGRDGGRQSAPARTRAVLLAACLAAAGCVPEPEGPVPVRAVLEGERFTIACHFECHMEAWRAMALADATWPVVAGLLQPDHAPSAVRRPRLHLYGGEGFDRADLELAGGRFGPERGFSVPDELSAHVRVVPGDTLELRAARQIVHETAHLVAHAVLPAARCLPHWLSEGLAAWAERQVGAPAAAAGTDPWLAEHVRSVARQADAGALTPASELLAGAVGAGQDAGDYAAASVFFEFLRTERPEILEAVLHWARSLGERTRCAPARQDGMAAVLATLDGAALDDAYRSFVAAARRMIEEELGGGISRSRGGRPPGVRAAGAAAL